MKSGVSLQAIVYESLLDVLRLNVKVICFKTSLDDAVGLKHT
jgi:hypothetical protein